jgi:hypothetical protein
LRFEQNKDVEQVDRAVPKMPVLGSYIESIGLDPPPPVAEVPEGRARISVEFLGGDPQPVGFFWKRVASRRR